MRLSEFRAGGRDVADISLAVDWGDEFVGVPGRLYAADHLCIVKRGDDWLLSGVREDTQAKYEHVYGPKFQEQDGETTLNFGSRLEDAEEVLFHIAWHDGFFDPTGGIYSDGRILHVPAAGRRSASVSFGTLTRAGFGSRAVGCRCPAERHASAPLPRNGARDLPRSTTMQFTQVKRPAQLAIFEEYGFTRAGGMWGDGEWKQLAPGLVVCIGQAYECEEGTPLLECEACSAPDVMDRRCIVNVWRGEPDYAEMYAHLPPGGWTVAYGEPPHDDDARIERIGAPSGVMEALCICDRLASGAKHMTIEEFRATAREVPDLGAENNDPDYAGVRARVYCGEFWLLERDGLWIEEDDARVLEPMPLAAAERLTYQREFGSGEAAE